MPGTESPRPRAAELVHQLTIVGWLLLGGEFGFILFQLERVRTVDGTRFATAWDQRIEVMSFVMLPPNIVALAPAAGVAALATFLAADSPRPAARSTWLDALLRTVAGIALTLAAVGVASIAEISTRVGSTELDSVFLRLGGISIAVGIAWLCRSADLAARPD